MEQRDSAPQAAPPAAPLAPRPHRPATLAAMALALASVTAVATRPAITVAETAMFLAINGLPDVFGWALVPAMQAGTLVAGPVAAAVASLRHRHRLAMELLAAGVVTWVAARIAKLPSIRPRPAVLLDDVVIRGGTVAGLGYPSAHAAVAAALATIAGAWLPWRWAIPLWALTVAAALGRVFIGAHLPLDVVGGMLLGGLVGAGVRTAFERTPLRTLFE